MRTFLFYSRKGVEVGDVSYVVSKTSGHGTLESLTTVSVSPRQGIHRVMTYHASSLHSM